MSDILVTGAAGFIGFHLAERLLDHGKSVIGFDNLNDYYDVSLKKARLERLSSRPNFKFYRADLAEQEQVENVFRAHEIEFVVNLAAQAGVRYSLANPISYVQSNIKGFVNILEACRHHQVRHLIYASSSSVYGAVTKMPFSVHQNVDHPISVYAATKKSNELLAHCYSHLFGLPTTGVRFFTVYGPWGRPDMALFLFAGQMLAGKPIRVFNHGQMERDFTFIDDIVEAVERLIEHVAAPNPDWSGDAPDTGTSKAPYRIYNIGNSEPVKLLYLIELLEKYIGCNAIKEFHPMQPGDVPATFADIDDLSTAVDFAPRTSIEEGVRKFVDWYREFYRV